MSDERESFFDHLARAWMFRPSGWDLADAGCDESDSDGWGKAALIVIVAIAFGVLFQWLIS